MSFAKFGGKAAANKPFGAVRFFSCAEVQVWGDAIKEAEEAILIGGGGARCSKDVGPCVFQAIRTGLGLIHSGIKLSHELPADHADFIKEKQTSVSERLLYACKRLSAQSLP